MARRLEAPASEWSSASSVGAGSATSACSPRWPRSRASASSPSACAAAPTRTAPCRSATSRRSPSRGSWRRSARRCELAGDEQVLEIGTGSGYSAAILARLAREVVSIERIEALARGARERLAALGIANVEVLSRRRQRWAPPSEPRSTAIAVHATAPAPPARPARAARLGGRLVIPIASRRATCSPSSSATAVSFDLETGEGVGRRPIAPCRFVPLLGRRASRVELERAIGSAPHDQEAFYALNFFSPAFIDQLKRGRKTATIRLGDKARKYQRGQVVWITVGHQHSPREKIFAAVIDDVEVKRVERALAARHRARQPGVSPARGDDRLPRADLRPRDRSRGHRDRGPLLADRSRRGTGAVRQRRDPVAATEAPAVAVEYRFLTTWLLESPSRARLGGDLRPEAWPSWWRGVEDVVELDPGDEDGVGSHSRLTWRSKLPYDLVFEARTEAVDQAAPDRGRGRSAS